MTARNSRSAVAQVAVARCPALRARFVALMLCLAIVGVPGAVAPARAHAGWPLAAGSPVVLGFGALYPVDGGASSRHRGVDIQAGAGDRVVAPLDGSVSFAGSVPGVGGGRVTAVTLETARGKITLLPLEHVSVKKGTRIAEGDELGTLAASGDGSSGATHLHVGVREGDLYVDPMTALTLPPVGTATSGAGSGEGAAAGAGAAGTVGAAGAGAGVSAGAVVAPSVVMPAGVSLAPRNASASAGSRNAALSGQLAPGVSIAVRGAAVSPPSAAGLAMGSGTARRSSRAADAPQPTVVGADGVVVVAGVQETPARAAVSQATISRVLAGVRAYATRSLRLAGLVLLGVMAALGALWPLWRHQGRKGTGKVRVSSLGEDVAAARGR